LIYLKLLCTAFFWGGTFIAGRIIATSVHPACAAFLRFLMASLFLVGMAFWAEKGLPRLSKSQVVSVVLLGLTGVFAYNLLFFTALKYIHAGRAALIIANNPILISLLSALIFKEPLNWIKAVGIGLSVTGAMVVISNGRLADVAGYSVGLGEVLIFGCVASWVAYSLIGKQAMKHLSPLVSVTYSSLVGTVLLFPLALFYGLAGSLAQYAVMDWASLFYLGFFGTALGFFWYYQGIEKIGPMKASVFINFVPISAIVLAFLMLREPVTSSLVIGAALVIMGVYITNAADMVKRFGAAMLHLVIPILHGRGR
jgi:drug/metabolite transporter (DMT)-like permease